MSVGQKSFTVDPELEKRTLVLLAEGWLIFGLNSLSTTFQPLLNNIEPTE